MDYQKLVEVIKRFNEERDWDQFHNIKDVASAINIEASELQELFLWKKNGELDILLESKRDAIESEVADIFAFLIIFCYKTNIDLEKVLLKKIEHNSSKYPVTKVKGSSKKYTEY